MPHVGEMLAEFRHQKRLSQLDLSGAADISARHLSFIETGRSNPSREVLLRIADVLGLPLRDCNLLLSAAGYSMAYSRSDLESPEMAAVKDALNLILATHPYPAAVLDGNWNQVLSNQPMTVMQETLVSHPIERSKGTVNVLKLIFQNDGLRPHIRNWEELASFTLRHLKKQVVAYGREENQQLLAELLLMNPPENWAQPRTKKIDAPMITVDLQLGDLALSVFSTLTQFGTALDVGLEELVIESYFPADEVTKKFFESFRTGLS